MAEMSGYPGLGGGRLKQAFKQVQGKIKQKKKSREIGQYLKKKEKAAEKSVKTAARSQSREVRQDVREENQMKRKAERGLKRAYRKDARKSGDSPLKKKFQEAAYKVKEKKEDIKANISARRYVKGKGKPKTEKANCSGSACETVFGK